MQPNYVSLLSASFSLWCCSERSAAVCCRQYGREFPHSRFRPFYKNRPIQNRCFQFCIQEEAWPPLKHVLSVNPVHASRLSGTTLPSNLVSFTDFHLIKELGFIHDPRTKFLSPRHRIYGSVCFSISPFLFLRESWKQESSGKKKLSRQKTDHPELPHAGQPRKNKG